MCSAIRWPCESVEAVEYYERGLAYYNLGEYDRAIAEYTQVIELDPQFSLWKQGPLRLV